MVAQPTMRHCWYTLEALCILYECSQHFHVSRVWIFFIGEILIAPVNTGTPLLIPYSPLQIFLIIMYEIVVKVRSISRKRVLFAVCHNLRYDIKCVQAPGKST